MRKEPIYNVPLCKISISNSWIRVFAEKRFDKKSNEVEKAFRFARIKNMHFSLSENLINFYFILVFKTSSEAQG